MAILKVASGTSSGVAQLFFFLANHNLGEDTPCIAILWTPESIHRCQGQHNSRARHASPLSPGVVTYWP